MCFTDVRKIISSAIILGVIAPWVAWLYLLNGMVQIVFLLKVAMLC